jgi:hypothetical protein
MKDVFSNRMKTRIVLISLGVMLTVGVAFLMSPAQSPVWLSTSSPNKTYTFELTGRKSRPSVPGVMNEARFNLLKGTDPLVKNAYVDSYDWFDSDFVEMYPEHKWVNESILRFGYKLAKSQQSIDSLTVSNRTDRLVRYLKITASDMIFVFDLPPRSATKLAVPHQGWLSWVAAQGAFSDGQSLPTNGVNFFHRDRLTDPLQYCVSVSEGLIKIESPVMDGYNGDATPEKPNVAKVTSCD